MEKIKEILEQASLRTLARWAKNWRNGLRILARKDARIVANYLKLNKTRALQIGTGPHPLDHWLNTDLYPRDEVIRLDATKPFRFQSDLFDYVFSEHMIEHVPWSCGLGMLKECFRVMKPGGRIRIVTPDLRHLQAVTGPAPELPEQEFLAWYFERHFPDAAIPGKCWLLNAFVRSWGHQFIYDEATLRETMHLAGFVDIVRGIVGASEESIFNGLENEARMPPGFLNRESIVLEAWKR